MARRAWKLAAGMVVFPLALAGCSRGGHPTVAGSASAKAAAVEGITAAMLKNALLTRVNGVAAAAPASSGRYGSVARPPGRVQVTPKACAVVATRGFGPAALAGAPAAVVTFRVVSNRVSEVLIASSDKSAATALAGHVPADCKRYQEKVEGKTFTYSVVEQAVTGIGKQAEALNAHAVGATSDNLWSLIYRGAGFVGTVTVIGPNASEKAVQELGQQAYAFAAKTLS